VRASVMITTEPFTPRIAVAAGVIVGSVVIIMLARTAAFGAAGRVLRRATSPGRGREAA